MKFKIIGFINSEFTLILRNIKTGQVMYWHREFRNQDLEAGAVIPDPRTEVMYDFT